MNLVEISSFAKKIFLPKWVLGFLRIYLMGKRDADKQNIGKSCCGRHQESNKRCFILLNFL